MSTAPTSSPLVKPSRISQLPAELLLMILGQLDYFDLKRVRRVCKAFDTLVKDPKFDRVLFRQGVKPLKPGQKVALHPILDLVDCMWVTATTATLMDLANLNVYEVPACDEFATAPACAALVLNMFDTWYGRGEQLVTSDVGLTVRDILHELAEYWETGPGAHSLVMEQGGHAFAGWRHPIVLKDGTVCLQACPFDH
ncbi:uncharacterized protein RHOBADRAFT_56119 [Rhodotorula graminis WP1]|uniref:F-box domain-containing protein n=1 Tax=Rhodotorula graminis (strain WP1) TaxID=578459 RepID=A0A0P9IRE1_RHOGW|nr:uncharacterized protein RHOBADRAFT_56119 [Rhodotorula graminis WP1]KPV71976.1 hypothetical protein RHOBADRAFT_56119 [Rhodotorula graminis WP1]